MTKDSVEVASFNNNTAASAGVPLKQAPAPGGHLRADAISLEVPVKVHGSRLADAAIAAAPRTEPFEEQTNSMIVFPQGGVLRMSTAVSPGQMLVVTNLKTRQDAICRVVKVRTFTNMQGYVEVEFTHKQPGFWGTRFPSDGSAESQVAGEIPAPATAIETSKFTQQNPKPVVAPQPVSPVLEMPVAAPPVAALPPSQTPAFTAPRPAANVSASKPEPSFISIGTQEEVQPAATSTSFVSSPEPVKTVAPARTLQPSPIQPKRSQQALLPEIPAAHASGTAIPSGIESDFPSAQATFRSELSLQELDTDDSETTESLDASTLGVAVEEDSESSVSSSATISHGTFGNLSGGGTLEIQGVQDTVSGEGRPVQKGWVPFAAGVLVTLTVVLGAIFFYRSQTQIPANSSAHSAPAQNSSVVPQPLVFQSPSAVSGEAGSSGTTARNSATNPVTIEAQSNAPAATSASAARPNAPAKATSRVTTGMMQEALDEHPIAASRGDADATNTVPSVDGAPSIASSTSGSVLGMVPSSNVPVLVAPSARPDGPIKVGGNVKEPRLLSRVMPEYPRVAKDTGVQGQVVINTTIDQKGNVVNMQVVSGPPLLREPALEALRRWKYEPSTLNGQPIAVQMLVILKFTR
ncbi:MAG: TonB family protein [Candidatus Acidiferrales bacterium]